MTRPEQREGRWIDTNPADFTHSHGMSDQCSSAARLKTKMKDTNFFVIVD